MCVCVCVCMFGGVYVCVWLYVLCYYYLYAAVWRIKIYRCKIHRFDYTGQDLHCVNIGPICVDAIPEALNGTVLCH